MKQKLQQFMMGRYGADQFSKVLMYISLGLLVVNIFVRQSILYWIAIALLVYVYFRMFSRNIEKRYQENQKFLNFRYRMIAKKDASRKQWEQRKIYRYYKCPGCRQKVRVPKGKGKICITCPKCRMEFVKRT
jgi:predicted membrane protein